MSQFVGTVIFKICSTALIDDLQQVVRIRMNTVFDVIIGLEKSVDKLEQTDLRSELLDEKQKIS